MRSLFALILTLVILPAQAAFDWDTALDGAQRSEQNKSRDSARHPRQTLEFFGLESGMTVVEVSPGGGWYSEILAPLMKGNGTYYAAHGGLNAPGSYTRNSLGKYLQKLAADTDSYSEVVITQLQPPSLLEIAPAGSADLVVAFRNVHSWLRADSLEDTLSAVHAALKDGGTFGLVQHRGKPGMSIEDSKKKGYIAQDEVVKLVEAAGFKLVATSEINANPRDTADHERGVWTLPPSLALGDVDRDKYVAIGETDRMTLKFVKQ
jgi:predicted methyltransferase